MSTLIWYGFDDKTTAQLPQLWDVVGPNMSITANGRAGGNALTSNYNTGDLNTKILPASIDTIVFGFACYIQNSYANNGTSFPFLALTEGTTKHVGFLINASGQIRAYRGATYLGVTTPTIPLTTWTYVEGKVKIGSTDGSVTLRVNGTQVASVGGLNTRNGGTTGLIDRFQIWPGLGASTFINYIDDLYVLDTNGATYNDFLGDTRILAATPSLIRPQVFVCT